jgi:TRAP-type C4-dicarboxylate transport system permease small subunit
MRRILLDCVVAAFALLLCGCAVNYSARSGTDGAVVTQTSGSHASVSANSPLGAAILVGILLADGFHYYMLSPDGTKTPVYSAPEPDPTRKINTQDCTRPIDPEAGNLVCR